MNLLFTSTFHAYMRGMIVFFVIAVAALFAIDGYVYLHWRSFVRRSVAKRSSFLHRSLPLYLVFMGIMPFTLPLYFTFSRWWEVEPKLTRALFFGFWTVYYLPKAFLAIALFIKDFGRFIRWLSGRFQEVFHRNASSPKIYESNPDFIPFDQKDMKQVSRRAFLERMGWTASTIPFVVTGYSVFRTLYDFKIHRVDVPLTSLPRSLDGINILQLSDLHAGSFFSDRPMHEAVDLIDELGPDLIVITGDYVNHDDQEMDRILPALNRLSAPLGVYGCLGNHDHYAYTPAVIERLKNTPVDLLVNQHATLSIDGARLHIIGTDNTGFNQNYADLPGALKGMDRSEHGEDVQILLAHDPTFWDGYVRPSHPEIDLMLCGHTHGGQVGFEMGPLRWSLARIAYPRWAGLYQEGRRLSQSDQFLYVNRGLGTIGPPIRFGVRPEITMLTLRKV